MVDTQHKLLYCPIPKNACTFFVKLILEQSQLADEFRQSGMNPHAFRKASTKLRLTTCSPFFDPTYFRFIIIREPIERIVSAYLNKFVHYKHPHTYPKAVKATRQFRHRKAIPDNGDLLSFSEFVEFLTAEPPERFDVHWKPQHLIVQPFAHCYDVVATMGEIPLLLELLSERIGKSLPSQPTPNRNDYHDYSEDFSESPPNRLRALEHPPARENLLTPRIRRQLEGIYRSDFDFYTALAGRSLSKRS